MEGSSGFVDPTGSGRQWYDLFSRGARDWLRHNDKVRAAVRDKLPELIAGSDLLPSGDRTVQVPVRFLEHARLRLRDGDEQQGVGQGAGKPGDQLVSPEEGAAAKGAGGNEEGGYQFILELKIDDIVDWLWEELKLPHLKRKEGHVQDKDFTREGWNRHGVRSRLDRRRSVREAIKRRAMHADAPAFTDEDLRFRQLVMRKQPTTEAVVFFAMDVSSSMTEQDRRLAKTFFFWVVQGLRRQYTHIEPVFIAHTVEAWEFNEDDFFQVTGSGGTVASTAFEKARDIIKQRFDPGRYNIYLFYASDGANFPHDADSASAALHGIGDVANFEGYIEVQSGSHTTERSEMGRIFDTLASEGAPAASYLLTDTDAVWSAIRAFFTEQSGRPRA
jgi:uncharacterized sporulation protein YeaH/YhbH (DUF444 family)